MIGCLFSFTFWNVRGLGDNSKCDDVLAELLSLKPSITFLHETKLQSITRQKSRCFLPSNISDFHFKPANGSAGGILTAFNNRLFTLQSYSIRTFSHSSTITLRANNETFCVTNVYAPTNHDQKPEFLNELKSIAPDGNMPWIVLGDFNLMRYAFDKNNSNFRQSEADLFNETIHDLALIELPLLDRRFTWSNNRDQPTLQRIDRAFINTAWSSAFPDTSLSSITRFISDHVPLVVNVSTSIPRPAVFRFENSWAFIPSARPTIESAWNSARNCSNGATAIVAATKICRQNLKRSRKSLKKFSLRESNAKTVISFLDHIEESRALNGLEADLRSTVILVLQRTIRERVSHWRQRSKIKFTIDGDENTKYFHVCASNRYRANKIAVLEHNGLDFSSHAQKNRHSHLLFPDPAWLLLANLLELLP